MPERHCLIDYDCMQGLVFCVGLESGIIKLYDIRCFEQGPFATFLVF